MWSVTCRSATNLIERLLHELTNSHSLRITNGFLVRRDRLLCLGNGYLAVALSMNIWSQYTGDFLSEVVK